MSCCQCLKIQITSSVTGMPAHFLNGSKLYLDIPENIALELSKSLSRLSDLEKIEDEAAIEFDIPYSPKNEIIGRLVRNHNLISNDYSALPVLVQEGSVVHHSFTELLFTGSSDTSKTFSVKLQRGSSHWIRGAREKYLNTIDFGTYEFTQANLEDTWTNNDEYIDGDQGVYFPLCHYGGWIAESTILVEDFRPWFHALSVLQKGFCEIGWSFRSPWLETSPGRRLGVYILREDYGFDADSLDNRQFLASAPVFDNNGVIIFQTEDYDPSNSYNPSTGEYTGSMEGSFTAVLEIEASSDGGQDSIPATLLIQIVKRESDGTITEIAGEIKNPPISSRTYNVTITGNTSITYGEAVYILITLTGDGSYTVNGGYFTNNPIRVLPQKGDILELNDYVHPDYTLHDILSGFAHAGNCKFKTDWVLREIWMYTPYDSEWYGDLVDGFYLTTPEDVTELIEVESEETTAERTSQLRYITLQFKGSTDAYIELNELEAANPLYSRDIDLGEGFIEETETSENPFFEPTANAIIDKFPAISPEVTTYNIDIPHLWDNDQGEVSYKIKPRMLYFFGYVYQIYDDDGGGGTTRKYRLENGSTELVPYAGQHFNSKWATSGLDPGTAIENDYAVYGTDNSDFYNLGYARELLTRKFAGRSSIRFDMSAQRYQQTDFRKLYLAYYNGRTFYFRQEDISTYRTCAAESAIVVIRPEPFIGDICPDLITVDPSTCQNRPRIDVTVNVSGDYISADADDSGIDSPIATDDWEYSTDDGANWSTYTPTNQISGFESVIFRREVSFSDGCPTKIVTRTGSFATACENSPGISLSYDDGTNTITATGTGSFNSSIDSDDWEVDIDGGGYSSYTEGDPVTGFDTITFRRTVVYTNSCPTDVITATYTVAGTPCDNDVSIVFTEVLPGSCAYSLSITGNSSTASFVTFQVSEDGGTTWRTDAGIAIRKTSNTVVRAFVYYSDGCPASVVQSECP